MKEARVWPSPWVTVVRFNERVRPVSTESLYLTLFSLIANVLVKHPRGVPRCASQSRYGKKVTGGRMHILVRYETVHSRYYNMNIFHGLRGTPRTDLIFGPFWSSSVRVRQRISGPMCPSPIANRPTWSTYYRRSHLTNPNSARERARRRGKKTRTRRISLILIGMT